ASRQARVAGPAAAIDLADDAAAGVGALLRDGDELVAEHAAKSHVAADQLQVGLADARANHPHHHLAEARPFDVAIRFVRHAILFQHDGSHVSNSKLQRMRVHLDYGVSGLDVDLPDERTMVIEPFSRPELADPRAALRAVMQAPMGRPPLREIVKPGQSIAISV